MTRICEATFHEPALAVRAWLSARALDLALATCNASGAGGLVRENLGRNGGVEIYSRVCCSPWFLWLSLHFLRVSDQRQRVTQCVQLAKRKIAAGILGMRVKVWTKVSQIAPHLPSGFDYFGHSACHNGHCPRWFLLTEVMRIEIGSTTGRVRLLKQACQSRRGSCIEYPVVSIWFILRQSLRRIKDMINAKSRDVYQF